MAIILSKMTIDELLSKFPSANDKKGFLFEKLVCWWLANDPYWKTVFIPDSISLWDESEHRWGRDAGIDITGEDFLGNIWAIQAKNWQSVKSLPKGEIDKFLTESNTKKIDRRMLVTTTNEISTNARGTALRQEKPVTVVTLESLRDSDIDWGLFLDSGSTKEARSRKTLRKHQTDAVSAVVSGFRSAYRGQLIMACGTGKTLTALRISEELNSETTLVLVPSLLLLQQTLHEWNIDADQPFISLAICSDETVTGSVDPSITEVADLDIPVTTNAEQIVKFLQLKGRKVIFSTYQSSSKVSEALLKAQLSLDLTIADEAHRLAGKSDEKFSLILQDDKIPSKFKLFMTATPRVFGNAVKSKAAENDVEILSMDDRDLFGLVFFEFNFQSAIKNKMLVDYRLVVIGVDDLEIKKAIKERRLLSHDGRTMDSRALASLIGLVKAMNKYELRKMISFHSRISRAYDFAHDVDFLKPYFKKEMGSFHISTNSLSGKHKTFIRKNALKRFLKLEKDEFHLITNARCLTEGIDVPTLDGIAFIDPRASQIDIIQAVGRAIRLGGNSKKYGYIVVPMFIPTSKKGVSNLEASEFATVFSVLKALTSHDEQLREDLVNLRTELGEKGHIDQLPENIIIDLPESLPNNFFKELNPFIIENTTETWMEIFGELKRFRHENGHLMVPLKFRTHRGLNLNGWMAKQRILYTSQSLSNERIDLLESLGSDWTWTPWEESWQQGFDLYVDFLKNNEGSFPVDQLIFEGFPLGQWVMYQRRRYIQGQLGSERIAQLEALGSAWSWNPKLDFWSKRFKDVLDFTASQGFLPRQNIGEEYEQKLGKWCNRQRMQRRKGELAPERIALLETIPNWKWEPLDDRWKTALMLTSDYYKRENKSPGKKETNGGNQDLYLWLITQRNNHDNGQLSEYQISELNEHFPIWNTSASDHAWTQGFQRLLEYVKDHGEIPTGSIVLEDGYKLGDWVQNKRTLYNRGTLNSQRIKDLESLRGWVWDVANATSEKIWSDALTELDLYRKEFGDLLVPAKYVSPRGFKLGQWVNRYRTLKSRNKLPTDKIDDFSQIDGWVWRARK